MVVAESLLLSVGGGIAGTALASGLLRWGHLGLGAEGVNISFTLTPTVIAAGLAASLITGILAAVLPAAQAARAPIAESLRKA
jgi:ABC-type antimicrobial peptide transport system permease subunit